MDLRKLAERLSDLVRRWLATARGWRSSLALFGVRRAGVEAPSPSPSAGSPSTRARAARPAHGSAEIGDAEIGPDFGPEFDWADPDFCSELYGPTPYGAAFASSLGGEWGEDAQPVSSRRASWATRDVRGAAGSGGAEPGEPESPETPQSETSADGISAWWSGPWWQAGGSYDGTSYDRPGDADWDDPDSELDDDFDWADTPEDLEDVEFELDLDDCGDGDGDGRPFPLDAPLAGEMGSSGPGFNELPDIRDAGDGSHELDDEPTFDPSSTEDSWQNDLASNPEDLQAPLAGFYSELDRAQAAEEEDVQLGDAEFKDPGELSGWFSADDSDASGAMPGRRDPGHDDFVDSDERDRFAGRPPILPSDFLELDWTSLEARLREDRS
jgi:hypothetical protein